MVAVVVHTVGVLVPSLTLMALVAITHFTDPACSFAFSAEPIRRRLRWHYGVQLVWRNVMIVLTAGDRREAERLAGGAPTLNPN